MSRVTQSLKARRDMMGHVRFIAEQSQSTVVVDRFVDRIHTRLALCAQFPDMGELCPTLGPGVRRVIEGNHLIYYKKSTQGIRVIRILHSSQDIGRVW